MGALVSAVVAAMCTWVKGQFDAQRRERTDERARREGELEEMRRQLTVSVESNRYLLKDRILQACQHWQDVGYCPMYNREVLSEMVKTYHSLGGNSFITSVYEDTMQLPTSADEQTVIKRTSWSAQGEPNG